MSLGGFRRGGVGWRGFIRAFDCDSGLMIDGHMWWDLAPLKRDVVLMVIMNIVIVATYLLNWDRAS